MALAPLGTRSDEDVSDIEEAVDEEVYVRAIGTETKVKELTMV